MSKIGKCWLTLVLGMSVLAGCTAVSTAVSPTPSATTTAVVLAAAVTAVYPTPTPTKITLRSAAAPAATPSPIPTSTQTPTPTATFTPTATPTATPIGPCSQRHPGDDLLAVVTKTYGLSREFEPADLVSLNDHLGPDVTLGYPTDVRAVMLDPLLQMIDEMKAAGLQPQILSGYRSYSAQAIAYNKWVVDFPDRADILSAPPGFSEHQLGTTIDFGSPELPDITGDPDLQFHTYFYRTSEGAWLLENAYRYGFTLSYPREASELTGFYYEPWHYRFVGVEMATQLHEMGISLTEFQFANQPEPCLPDA